MDFLYVLYKIDDYEPDIIGVFDDRLRLEEELPGLQKDDRFQVGFTYKTVSRDRISFWGDSYEINHLKDNGILQAVSR